MLTAHDEMLARRRSRGVAHDVTLMMGRQKKVGGHNSLSGSLSGFVFSIVDSRAGTTQTARTNVGDNDPAPAGIVVERVRQRIVADVA
jgi:hypothetical protein